MPSRRTFLRAAAATVAMPFAGISPAAATQRTILNDASRLSPTPVTKHVTISKPAGNVLIERIRAELKEAAASKRPVAASVARAVGAGRQDDADALVLHAIIIAIVFGEVFMLGTIRGGPALYRALGGRSEALDAALKYSNYLFAGAIPVWMFFSHASFEGTRWEDSNLSTWKPDATHSRNDDGDE